VNWAMGDCFRCDRGGIQVAPIGELTGGGAVTPIWACRACVEQLAAMHESAHAPPVRPYVLAHTP
jgi:hypothetical protein